MTTTKETGAVPQGAVLLEIDGPVAIIRLGGAEERAVVLTEQRMETLAEAIHAVSENENLKGLVIIGSESGGFCAGADINLIERVTSIEIGTELARRGQEVFAMISQLKLPTVAAIHGACVGGGCELALACQYRILLSASSTRIGLPEIKLGIIPGFGGTQRMTATVGVRKAIELILKGRLIGAKEAIGCGLANESVEGSYRELEVAAKRIAAGERILQPKQQSFVDRAITLTKFGSDLFKGRVSAAVQKETKGFYPAPKRAIEAIFAGLQSSPVEGYEVEARALGELIISKESKALVHVFKATDGAGKIGRKAAGEISKMPVEVLGAGVMGSGIASQFLLKGSPVSVRDTDQAALTKAKAHITKVVEDRRGMGEEEKRKILSKLTCVDSSNDGESNGQSPVQQDILFIEAIVEDLGIKKKVFESNARRVSEGSILASNTSSLSVSDISATIPKPERVVGMHFFNPAEKMPLVEIVRGKETDERTIVRTAALASYIGKYPIIVEDRAGFVVNRILCPYLIEATTLVAEGLDFNVIDRIAEEFGMPMGPIRLLDEIGLDVAAKVVGILSDAFGSRMAGPDYAMRFVAAKRFGKKSGAGFYRYENSKPIADSEARKLLGLVELAFDHSTSRHAIALQRIWMNGIILLRPLRRLGMQ